MDDVDLIRQRFSMFSGAFDRNNYSSLDWLHSQFPQVIKRASAVLVPLIWNQNSARWELILTMRSKKLSHHAGEVCLPGGHRDMQVDRSPVETALREAHEEIGLPASQVEIVGQLTLNSTRDSVLIYPIVGVVKQPPQFDPILNLAEVQFCFKVPLELFLNDSPDCHTTMDLVNPQWSPRKYLLHFFKHLDDDGLEISIFGVTAQMCLLTAAAVYRRLPRYRIYADGLNEPDDIETLATVAWNNFLHYLVSQTLNYFSAKL